MSGDTHAAEAPEAGDPKAKQRDEFNARACAALQSNADAARAIGAAIMDGTAVPRPAVERVRWPVGNAYLNRDDLAARQAATAERPYVRIDRAVAESADAVESLLGADGVVGLRFLIDLWGVDLAYLQGRNARHRDEVAKLQQAGRGATPKCEKRVALLAVDEPAAALLERRIAWAREQLGKAATRSGGG